MCRLHRLRERPHSGGAHLSARFIIPDSKTKLGADSPRMKSMGDGVILKSGTAAPAQCLHYALSLPTSLDYGHRCSPATGIGYSASSLAVSSSNAATPPR